MLESQKLVFFVASGIAGLLVGSFLNVCIFRLPRHCMSIVKPRSRCTKCLRWIAWYDNLPVVSWLILGGKCRGCKAPISPRYALVELLTGAIYLYAGWRALYGQSIPGHEVVWFAVVAWFMACLIVCTFIDYDFQILPDEITMPGIVIGLLLSIGFPCFHSKGLPPMPFLGGLAEALSKSERWGSFAASAFGAVAGAGILYVVGILGKILFRKRIEKAGETEAMGFGDVKYLAMFGAVLGWDGMLLGFMVACLVAAAFGILKLIVLRRMGYVPFGPFLSAGAMSILFWREHVMHAIRVYMGWMNSLSLWVLQLFGYR
jgi:leader peptidase (prepilin peptidase)/N-methyltransferase